MIYADYDFYTGVYHGNAIEEENYQRYAFAASSYIKSATMGRSDNTQGEILAAVKLTCCVLAEIFQDESAMSETVFSEGGSDDIVSAAVGSLSETYGTYSKEHFKILDSRKRETLLMYLGWTGLLNIKKYYASRW